MSAPAVQVRGIASAVPTTIATVEEGVRRFGEAALKIANSTGIRNRRVAGPDMCTSDLCLAAASRMLAGLGWAPHTIDVMLMVTQTPDYVLPATSCALHAKLGLSKHCACLDVGLGCSGYVVGLWLATSLLQSGAARRVLLLAGDTISRTVSSDDRSVAMLFGDAGTATALEVGVEDDAGFVFEIGTDGRGAEHIMIPAGGFRHPVRGPADPGGERRSEHLSMNGAEVFAFTLREVPPLVRSLLDKAHWTLDDVDSVVMHQANRFILEHLGKKMEIPAHKVVIELEGFGNTSSASIPLAITQSLGLELERSRRRLLLAGFGVGLSWAGAALSCGPMFVPPVMALASDGSTTDLQRGRE